MQQHLRAAVVCSIAISVPLLVGLNWSNVIVVFCIPCLVQHLLVCLQQPLLRMWCARFRELHGRATLCRQLCTVRSWCLGCDDRFKPVWSLIWRSLAWQQQSHWQKTETCKTWMVTQFTAGSAADYIYVFLETGKSFVLHPGAGCRQASSSYLHIRPLSHCHMHHCDEGWWPYLCCSIPYKHCVQVLFRCNGSAMFASPHGVVSELTEWCQSSRVLSAWGESSQMEVVQTGHSTHGVRCELKMRAHGVMADLSEWGEKSWSDVRPHRSRCEPWVYFLRVALGLLQNTIFIGICSGILTPTESMDFIKISPSKSDDFQGIVTMGPIFVKTLENHSPCDWKLNVFQRIDKMWQIKYSIQIWLPKSDDVQEIVIMEQIFVKTLKNHSPLRWKFNGFPGIYKTWPIKDSIKIWPSHDFQEIVTMGPIFVKTLKNHGPSIENSMDFQELTKCDDSNIPSKSDSPKPRLQTFSILNDEVEHDLPNACVSRRPLGNNFFVCFFL